MRCACLWVPALLNSSAPCISQRIDPAPPQSHKLETKAAGPKVRSAGKTTFRDELSAATIKICTRHMEELMPRHVVQAFSDLAVQLIDKNGRGRRVF